MSELNKLLRDAKIHRALVVDDAYDAVPKASDLSIDIEDWIHFFDDIVEPDLAILRRIYPSYDQARADDLQTSDAFVATLWQNREQFRPELISSLFARYDSDSAADQGYLRTLTERLPSFGLEYETAGRAFQDRALSADLIFIDLFLSSAQEATDIKYSVEGLAEVVLKRRASPPVVILMSRSSRLEQKRDDFRDRSGLFESAFRIIQKKELTEPGKLERLLVRLARHHGDSLKLAAFLDAWMTGLQNAGKRTSDLIRKLDLSDHAQIHQLLLSAEGEPTGAYTVDIFDRVLQHELERETAIIDAAISLNDLTSDLYPPPYAEGSPDLQQLVYRSLFQNRERLRLSGAQGSRVAFGDLLRRRAYDPQTTKTPNPQSGFILAEIKAHNVLAVLTPACDLQRRGAKRVLLLVGSMSQLLPTDWSYKEDPVRTPVVELQDGSRWWIKWDLKHVETLLHSDIDQLLGRMQPEFESFPRLRESHALELQEGRIQPEFEIFARLRESHALELQQKLLSELGRVGLIAPMPATFSMRVEVYLPAPDKKLQRLTIPELDKNPGVCYVGRPGEKEMRLIFCEDVCDAICDAFATYDSDLVHPNAREAFGLLVNGELVDMLERGVVLPSPQQQGFKEIGSRNLFAANSKPRVVGVVGRNIKLDEFDKYSTQTQRAGIVLATWDENGKGPQIVE